MNHARVAALAAATMAVQPVLAADWNDSYLGYRHGARFQEPAIGTAITKDVVSFTHANRYRFGSHFLNVDVFMSDRNDPANGAGSGGAQEIYVTYRHQLSFGRVLQAPLAFGPVRDLSFTAGFDLNTKDTAFAPRKRALVAGPTVNFDIPGGFLDLGFWYYQERNHNAFGVVKDVRFDATLQIGASWSIPVPLGPVATAFKGFANHTRSKGTDGALVETEPETLVRAAWMVDAGALLGLRPQAVWAGPGYEFWDHKFGNPDPIPVPGSAATRPNDPTRCLTFHLEWHF